MIHRLRPFFLCVLGAALVPAVRATVPAPPAPAVYDVRIRYRIDAFRNERVVQYGEMMRFLQAHGFRRDPNAEVPENEAEDRQATRLDGTVPGKRALELAAERHVQSILLVPQGAMLPGDAKALVRVHLGLHAGLPADRQHLLYDQAREVLASIGFREGAGYDHRGFTRLVGMIPVGQLDTLLTDLRTLPAGTRQPAPFQTVWPLRETEVLPTLPLPSPRSVRPPPVARGQEKLTADLREVLADAKGAAAPRRLEVILANLPAPEDRFWKRGLASAVPGMVIEGRLGPVVTVMVPPSEAPALAALDAVAAVRLPRVARPGPQVPGATAETWKPLLDSSGVARLHDLKHRGRGARVAVIDSDFAGWKSLAGKDLPAATRLIDLTLERNADLQPDPFPTRDGLGSGTRRAVTLSRAAPEAELTLIRIDPAAAYMLYQAAQAINGDPYQSVSMDNRLVGLEAERRQLDQRHDELLEERKLVLEDFSQEPESVKRREAYRKKQAEWDVDQRAHVQRVQLYFDHQKAIRGLRGVRVVASALGWDEGFPADGGSTLSRYFDDRPFRAALWFQAAGNTRGQSWAGLFRDEDNNGVMEFVPPGTRLPEDVWTPELNFLSWRPSPVADAPGSPRRTPAANAPASPAVPANARLRVSLQWREAHEGLYARLGEDLYREPLARLRLVMLYQPDPTGAARPADDLEIVAQSAGLPQRLDHTANSAVYEQTVELVAKKAGRYAVRIEGRAPEGILPRGEPALPGNKRMQELHVRLFVNTLEGAGRAAWADHATDAGSVAIPADARTVIAVGAADRRGRRQPYSAGGSPFNLDLLPKPDVLTYDEKGEGTAGAAAFAAGMAAAARSAGVEFSDFLPTLRDRPGGLLRVPPSVGRGEPRRFEP
jgi:hypothetical protein